MGFYVRKSISVGPLRFNLSKSGVGVSAGIPGLRFGVGPRGNYVHLGRGGLYYRATLPSNTSSRRVNSPPPLPAHRREHPETHAPLEEIESTDALLIVDSSSKDLLDELNRKRAALRLWPVIAAGTGAALVTGFYLDWASAFLGWVIAIGTIGTILARARDTWKKTVVLFYEFDPEMEAAYAGLHDAASQLSSSHTVWHIEASGKVYDRKYHAGANSLVRRKPTFVRKMQPPYVKTNVETVALGVGRQTLHFFPDRVLVYDSKGVGAVSYGELNVEASGTRFIESESVPRDARVIDRTWRYVNKSGGPDRRFKNNRELPVCLYEEVRITSRTGLNELIMVSKSGDGSALRQAILHLARKMPGEGFGQSLIE